MSRQAPGCAAPCRTRHALQTRSPDECIRQSSIIRSRMTLATMEAAATETERWSPLTKRRRGAGQARRHVTPVGEHMVGSERQSAATARRMASRLALRMSVASMSSADIEHKAYRPRHGQDPPERFFPRRACPSVWNHQAPPEWPPDRVSPPLQRPARPSGPRPASSVPATQRAPFAIRLQLNGKIRPQGQVKKGRRIGCAAGHDGGRLGTRFRFSASPPGTGGLRRRSGGGCGCGIQAGGGDPARETPVCLSGMAICCGERRVDAAPEKYANKLRNPHSGDQTEF